MADYREYITKADENGNINISEEVVAFIAAGAAVEVEGVHGLYISPGKDTIEILGKRRIARGVKIRKVEDSFIVDIYVVAKLGCAVSEVGKKVQSSCAAAIEAATGMAASAVNVHICAVSLKN